MTSALDMPEIMSYIYSKSWKLQFSASSSIIIIEDYYLQTFLHSLSLCNAQELFICRPLFICAVCINYRLNLLHKGIIVVLVINSAEHWFAYNIAISVNKYSCWKCHDF